MDSTFFKHFSSFSLQRWFWLKIGFYFFYFLIFQLTNNFETRFFVNILFFLVAIGIIEMGIYCFQWFFRERLYKKAIFTFLGIYIALAVIGYYLLHGSENMVATKVWDRQFEASWVTFLLGFNHFYWVFFKYAVILFLVQQLLLLLKRREPMHVTPSSKTNALGVMPSHQIDTATNTHARKADFLPLAHEERRREAVICGDRLIFKVGATTYMLDIVTLVYLEVSDDTTTIYRIDGSCLEVKVSLTDLCEWLPKDRIVRVHESRAVAIPYIFRELKDHLYMVSYEDKPLKLGSQEKYPLYKRWKERNLLNNLNKKGKKKE